MTQHQIFTATELVPLLRERRVGLSASQVHRLVSGTLERLSLQVMAALCDILSCTPADLVAAAAEKAGVRKTAAGDLPAPPANVAKLWPAPPASCPTHAPYAPPRAVRTLVHGQVLPLRPPQTQGRDLALPLPHLAQAGRRCQWRLRG
ncbi:helix-turn-helix domain-containing protein [Streptomyces sp. NPDC057963]|uniref:helix-turn-helix domain-containing protein n=1 Tax=Streptomyces sp. NPDC057963 TaxID=3346290 RepID=UPI0036E12C1D